MYAKIHLNNVLSCKYKFCITLIVVGGKVCSNFVHGYSGRKCPIAFLVPYSRLNEMYNVDQCRWCKIIQVIQERFPYVLANLAMNFPSASMFLVHVFVLERREIIKIAGEGYSGILARVALHSTVGASYPPQSLSTNYGDGMTTIKDISWVRYV